LKLIHRNLVSLYLTQHDNLNGEIDDVHYKFITKQLFEEGINNKEYIEYASTHGNYYGTHYQALERMKNEHKICVLEIDVKGAKQIKEYGRLHCIFLFVTCHSPLITLEQRLINRGTENREQIKTRLDTAKQELVFVEENPDFFDYILLNGDLDESINELTSVLNRWYPWLNL